MVKTRYIIIIFLVSLLAIFLLAHFLGLLKGLWVYPLPDNAHCTQIIHDPMDGSAGNYYCYLDFTCEHDFCARRYLEPYSTECNCLDMTAWAKNALVAEYGDYMESDDFYCDQGLLGCIAYFCQDECPVGGYQRCMDVDSIEECRKDGGTCLEWLWVKDCPSGYECVQQGNYAVCETVCSEGWLDEYRCDGDLRERKYQYSDCSTVWKVVEDCNDRNYYTSCSWSCYDSDTRRCSRTYYDYYCSGGGTSCIAQTQDASYNEDCPSGQVCENGVCVSVTIAGEIQLIFQGALSWLRRLI